MARRLSAFLDEAMRKTFAWGQFDCVLFLADWSVERLGRDPAAAYRGRYRTALGAQRIIRRAGGLVSLIAREFEPRGWQRTKDVGPGDIGLIEAITYTGGAPCGAIFTGSHWCILAQGGLIAVTGAPLASWRPICPTP